jgi:histone H3/H4
LINIIFFKFSNFFEDKTITHKTRSKIEKLKLERFASHVIKICTNVSERAITHLAREAPEAASGRLRNTAATFCPLSVA